ncbi:molybdopterin guanine dinucleotide-containing S/N-oxide reductase-like protein [Ewingella americana]
MTIRRFPQLAHWGAYTAVVEDGRLIRCEPHAADSDPSPMLDSIIPLVYSDKRIRKPAVRRSWLQKREHSNRALRGKEDFVEVDWDVALDLVAEENRRVRDKYGAAGIFTGSYGWSSAGRLHHARSLVRRFYFTGGGGVDQEGNYSWGTAQFFLPYIIGTFTPLTGRVTTWPSVVDNAEILLAFGGLALKNAQVASGGAVAHTLKPALEQLAKKGTPIVNISPMRDDCPEFANAEWIPIRPNTDAALMMALAFEIQRVGAQDDAFLASHCVGYPQLAAYLQGKTDGVEKTPEWAQPDHRHPGCAHRPTGAAADWRAQLYYLCLLGAARPSRRAALLDDDCPVGDARAGGAAGRRLLLWSRLDERRRQPAF